VKPADWRLFCFDLDGTLIRGTSSSQHLAERLGHAESLMQLEARYARNEISNQVVADESAFHFKGRSANEIAKLMEGVPLIDGIEATMAKLRDKRITTLLSTVTWRFAAAPIAKRFGFAEFSGTEMHADSTGILSGVVSRHFDEFDKREFVIHFCEAHGIPASQVVAVGDSRSDIPLFKWAGFSVALNASAAAKAAATVSVETGDLQDIFRFIPA
jgi:phosphoserine phosphatase